MKRLEKTIVFKDSTLHKASSYEALITIFLNWYWPTQVPIKSTSLNLYSIF